MTLVLEEMSHFSVDLIEKLFLQKLSQKIHCIEVFAPFCYFSSENNNKFSTAPILLRDEFKMTINKEQASVDAVYINNRSLISNFEAS